MDRNFAWAPLLVLKSEGRRSDNPADPGGATVNGVTLADSAAMRRPTKNVTGSTVDPAGTPEIRVLKVDGIMAEKDV